MNHNNKTNDRTSKKDKKAKWAEHFREILNRPPPTTKSFDFSFYDVMETLPIDLSYIS